MLDVLCLGFWVREGYGEDSGLANVPLGRMTQLEARALDINVLIIATFFSFFIAHFSS